MKILVVNSGSSSLKFSMYDMGCSSQSQELREGNMLFNGKIAGIGGEARCILTAGQSSLTFTRKNSDITAAFEWMCEILQGSQRSDGYWEAIEAVGHRLVHGGEVFTQAVRIDDDVLTPLQIS